MITSRVDNPGENLACFVIDDPLIEPRYGCLDYKELLNAMKHHNFFTEIAFIPWNYKRSNSETVRLLADNANYFSICVHGCNHTANEFGGRNYHELRSLLSTALWRMEQHKLLTGLSYDPVFVFPQGQFSSVAMQALKDQGFLAAFNSTIKATDVVESPSVNPSKPAITDYHNFPLFMRRYPKDKTGIINDLNNGKPIIIVEHHGFFRNGYKNIIELVEWINSLDNIKWTSLFRIAEYYLGETGFSVEKGVNSFRSSPLLNIRIALRRLLSEARDNYIETNSLLTKVYKLVRG